MMNDDEKLSEFQKLAKPLVEFLDKNFHPHHYILLDCRGAEILEGCFGMSNQKYLKNLNEVEE